MKAWKKTAALFLALVLVTVENVVCRAGLTLWYKDEFVYVGSSISALCNVDGKGNDSLGEIYGIRLICAVVS